MVFALYNGGPQTFAWSIVICYFGALMQSASIAEMASTVPIAGAQYHWTYVLAPSNIRRFTTWMQGWMTWFGWVSLLAGTTNITVLLLQNMAFLNNPNYVPEQWHVTLMMIAMLTLFGVINSNGYTFALVPWLELVAGVLHIGLFVLWMCVLLVLGTRHTGTFMFTHFEVWSGWNNDFVAWNLGMLTCVWALTGFDGAVHMAEEVKSAKQAVPRAIFWSIALNGVLAYSMVLAILSSMGPLDEELLFSTFPASLVLLRCTGSLRATTALLTGLFIVSCCSVLACIASVSRLTWAWARDGGIPRWFAYVHPTHLVPIRAIWLGLTVVMLLSLLNIGSTTAFGAIVALASMALYFSYAIALFCMLYARYQSTHGGQSLVLGQWNLGRYGVYINIYSLIYTLYVMVFLPFPSTIPVDATNMNYCGPIFLFVFFFAIALWFFKAQRGWPGPSVAIINYVKQQED